MKALNEFYFASGLAILHNNKVLPVHGLVWYEYTVVWKIE